MIVITIIVFFLDRILKTIIINDFYINETLPLIRGVVHFTYIKNTGIAFGLFQGVNFIFVLFSFVFLILFYFFWKNLDKYFSLEKTKEMRIICGLILGGVLGNLFDRIFYGGVIDFIDLRIWPVFNVADSSVFIGAAIFIYLLWKSEHKNVSSNS